MAKTERGNGKTGRGQRILRGLLALGILAGGLGLAPRTAEAEPIGFYPIGERDACGAKLMKGSARQVNPSYWSCTLAENFDGTSLDPNTWTVQTTAGSGFGDGGECFVDSPENVAVANGTLRLTARRTSKPFTCDQPASVGGPFQSQFTAGSVHTGTKFNQTYGRFEIRAKMPAVEVPGLQFAFWLWPENALKYGDQWPMSGELDIMEWYSLNPDHAIPTMHYAQATYDPNYTNFFCTPGLPAWSGKTASKLSDWHTYTLEWTPRSIKFIYDGKLCLENTNWDSINGITQPAPFDHPFMLSLTQALGYFNPTGPAEHNVNKVTATTPLPATATIDYVKVWK